MLFAASVAASDVAHPTYFVSWKPKREPWHFAFFVDGPDRTTRADLKRATSTVVGVPALKRALVRLPRGRNLSWCDSPIDGFVLPPPSVTDDVVTFAAKRGIQVELNPAVIE